MTLRQHYARPRPRAITRHPDQPGRAAAAAHTGPPGSAHRVSLPTACTAARAAGAVSGGVLPQVAGPGPVPVGVLWVTCRPLRVVNPPAARDGETSRDGAPGRISGSQPGPTGYTTKETAMHPAQHSPN